MRLKRDENLPASVRPLLAAHGHDVTTVLQEGLGGTPDDQVARACLHEGRALVTLDRRHDISGQLWIVGERRVRIRE
jgi:predicted nuclease of predicted toxin-antitoxin system